jgi:hypothetical protein
MPAGRPGTLLHCARADYGCGSSSKKLISHGFGRSRKPPPPPREWEKPWEAGTATGAWRSTHSRPSTPSPQQPRPLDPARRRWSGVACRTASHGFSRSPYQGKRADGKNHREALRCLKRRLCDAVYRRLVRDAHPDTATGPGGHPGATTHSSAVGSTPTTDPSDKSLPGPAETDPTNHTPRST